ncbi:MAG: repair ATPase [Verrucomicrobiales bacterium]|nr:repair ATPase [Verrucomicrobiales bacterium]
MKSFCAVLLIGIVAVTGCRNVMYSTYEKFGVYKRDLLAKKVTAARDEQKGAQQEFKDALTRLKEMTGFEGGKLEKEYRSLQSNYNDAAARVTAVHKRINDVETVAHDLFSEWEKENAQISTESLRRTSREQLSDTRIRYERMVAALKDAEGQHGSCAGQIARLRSRAEA